MDEVQRARLSSGVFADMVRTVHGTGQEVSRILREDGLNPAQLQLLLAVREAPGSAQRVLGERLGTTPANVSMLVSRLEDRGWLRREAAGAANRLWLTDVGQALADRLGAAQQQFMAARFAALGDDDLETLARLLRQACDN